MKLYLKITLYLLVLIALGCNKGAGIIKNENNKYFSFGEVGNEWTYERTTISGFSSNVDTTIDTFKYTIMAKLKENLYTVKYSYPKYNYEVKSTWYFSTDEFGYYDLENNGDTQIMLKEDSQVGDSYYAKFLVLGINENVDVLGDTLSCFKVNTVNGLSPNLAYWWVHKDQGIVQLEHQEVGPNLSHSTSRLIHKNF